MHATHRKLRDERIEQHGRNLLAIFPNARERDPAKLCKKLRRLEAEGQAIALRLCNGPEYPRGEEEVDRLTDAVLAKVDALLGNWTDDVDDETPNRVHIFVNRDPRGYALKIRSGWMATHNVALERDWGGFGILAPTID